VRPTGLPRLTPCALLALVLWACVSDSKAPERTPLALTMQLAAADEPLHRGLVASTQGWRAAANGEIESAVNQRRLSAQLAATSVGAFRASLAGDERVGLTIATEGARPTARVRLEDGRAVYADALPDTDVVAVANADWVELLYLLRTPLAPTELRWRVALGAGLAAAHADAFGAIVFQDAAGQSRLRIPPAFALDATGARREAKLTWNAGVLTASLDTNGLRFPVLLDPAVETVAWERLDVGLGNRALPQMAYDASRQVVVLFGGWNHDAAMLDDTWEWNGVAWTKKTPATRPTARREAGMVFDTVRNRIVMFGGNAYAGSSFVGLNDTWEYDGVDWVQKQPTNAPPPRYGHGMAFDTVRGKAAIFGGWSTVQLKYLTDTWEWDGSNWSQASTSARPAAGSSMGMVYDAERGYTVQFGGYGGDGTWTWNGSAWTRLNPATEPPARYGHALVYDSTRKRVVCHGGYGFLGDTWEWDGSTWTRQTPARSPSARGYAGGAYDGARGNTVLFGGQEGRGFAGDTWTYAGTTWTKAASSSAPPPAGGHVTTFDTGIGRLLLLAESDTWEFDGVRWTELNPPTRPTPRSGNALAYDATRSNTVMFGGASSSNTLLGETWLWASGTWQLVTPSSSPSPRVGHAMAYDQARGNVVLFGGYDGARRDDTWTWNGSTWSLRSPTNRPTPRNRSVMAYDDRRQRILLFGGYDTRERNDTWEWDGTNWTERQPSTMPPARDATAMMFDSARGVATVFGGDYVSYLNDTWEWTGTTWTQRMPLVAPRPREAHTFAFDPVRGKGVLLDGYAYGVIDDTWLYRVVPGPAASACVTDAECQSGHCVDGVCCNTACGNGDRSDCQACSVAAGAPSDGVCTVFPSSVICRTAKGVCDVAERCDGVTGACPADALAPTTTVCHTPISLCDREIRCTANTVNCPPTQVAPQGTVCRASARECDRAETCNGTSDVCDPDSAEFDNTPCTGGVCKSGVCTPAPPDAGSDASSPSDASPATDATSNADAAQSPADAEVADAGEQHDGSSPASEPAPTGCSCRTGARRAPSAPLGIAIVGLLAAALRRRSRASSAS
jgi:hypothetical protein